MKDKQFVQIKETNRDRYARITQTVINNKTIQTPCFSPRITKSPNYDELELFIRLRTTQLTQYLGVHVVRLPDLNKVIDPKLVRIHQTTLDNSYMEEGFLKFRKNNVFLVDPSLEYLYYERHMKNLASTPNIPEPIKEYVHHSLEKKDSTLKYQEYKNWHRSFHSKFWHELDKDRRSRNRLVGELLDHSMEREADLAIPPVPLATNESLFDLAISINRISRELINANYESVDQCATYFLLPAWILTRKESVKRYILSKLEDYIIRIPAKLTILKFKNLNIGQGRIVEREEIRTLADTISRIKKAQPERLFMLLEAGIYASPLAAVGFDIVSTSLTGHDSDGGFSFEKRGKWFDPKELITRSISDVWTMYKNGDDNLPCYCTACRQMSETMKKLPEYKSINFDEWNMFRREHYCLTMNEIMRQIEQAIKDKQIELITDKLVNSELALLRDVIPRAF